MSITPTTLTRAAAAAAIGAGVVFIGVQIGHPHLDAESIQTTELAVRGSFKVLMAVLALVGITGMYLRQVRQAGVLGLVGYVTYAVGYLLILGSSYAAAFILPAVAETDPAYVDDMIEVAKGGSASGDVGAWETLQQVQGFGYLVGGLVFGIALYRARVLTRWASALLAVSGLVTAALTVLPDAFYRFLAYPNGIAMIALGWSLWRSVATDDTTETAAPTAGALGVSS
jgi:hypothetical protein